MFFNQILKIELSPDEIKQAILKSKEQHFIDNLRDRHPNVAFDCKMRGYIGEISLHKWFNSYGIPIETTNFLIEDLNMDVDFSYKNLDIELKTSLVPDIDENIENVFNRRDIKIIKREEDFHKIKGDVHIQIYYDHKTKMKDNWLKNLKIDLESNDIDYLYDTMLAKSYINKSFLFCWIDKFTLIKRLELLEDNKRFWSHVKREFWVCPLRNSLPPLELISFLKRF